jgi:hypothetical protein
VIEVACTIAPLCGLSLHQIMWELPAAVAYQIFNFAMQMHGAELVRGPSEAQLLERLKRWQT